MNSIPGFFLHVVGILTLSVIGQGCVWINEHERVLVIMNIFSTILLKQYIFRFYIFNKALTH